MAGGGHPGDHGKPGGLDEGAGGRSATLRVAGGREQAAGDAQPWHTLSGPGAAKLLHVDPPRGLSSDEAAARLAELGPNRLAVTWADEPRLAAFVRQYGNATQLVLLVAAATSLVAGQLATATVMAAVTLVNAVLGLRLEGRPPSPVAALERTLATGTRVRRDGRVRRVRAEAL